MVFHILNLVTVALSHSQGATKAKGALTSIFFTILLQLTHFLPTGWGYTVVGKPCLQHKVEETLQKPPSPFLLCVLVLWDIFKDFSMRWHKNFKNRVPKKSSPHLLGKDSLPWCPWCLLSNIFYSSFSLPSFLTIMLRNTCHGSHFIIFFFFVNSNNIPLNS